MYRVPKEHLVFEGGTTAAMAAGLNVSFVNVSTFKAGGAAPGSDPYSPLYATAAKASLRLDWEVRDLPCGKFAVSLYFARPPPEEKGQHVYDIFLEEQRVEAGFDPTLVPRGGGSGRGTVRKFTGVRVFDNTLAVSVRHISGNLDKSVHLSALSIAKAGSAGEPAPPPNEAQLKPNPSSGTEAGLRQCILKRDGAHIPSAPDAGLQPSTPRYLVITVLGGLNQQRKGIVNAVVAARLLNVTLVAPSFQHEDGYWDGSGDMDELYDLEHFIAVLKGQVEVIRELPAEAPPVAWMPGYYWERHPNYMSPAKFVALVAPYIADEKSTTGIHGWHIQLHEKLSPDLQRLRCLANFHALRYKDSVSRLGHRAVQSLKARGSSYVAVHMRLESDWLRFMGCQVDNETGTRLVQKGLQPCAFSPGEVALLLQVMGFKRTTPVYIAGGAIAGGAAMLQPLADAFPVFDKYSLLGESLAAPNRNGTGNRLSAGIVGPAANGSSPVDKDLLTASQNDVALGVGIDHMVARSSDFLILIDGRSNWGQVVEGERLYFATAAHPLETFVPDRAVLKPLVEATPVDEQTLACTLHELREEYRRTGCEAEREYYTPGFCRPLDCLCRSVI